MSNHSVIEHRASYHFIKLEEDYLAICSKGETSPHCKAFILSIIEHWMNTKRARGEGDYAYLTMPEWIKHMYMLYERNVVENCIKELLKEGLIIRRPIKRHGQKTFEYTLNVDAIHALIKSLPLKEANDTLPNLDNYLAHRERSKAEKREVREKSRTVSEKSRTLEDSEKSHRVREKSRQRYVKNQLNIDSITEIPEIESMNDKPDEPTVSEASFSHSSTQSTSLIANPAIEKPTKKNAEPVTTRNASSTPNVRNTEPLLSKDGERVRDYWSQLGFESTSASNTHWNTLSKHIASLEQMDSLYKYARAKLKNADDPTVHPGNMVKAVNGWKQKQAPDLVAVGAQQPKPKTKKQAEEEWIASLKADPWK